MYVYSNSEVYITTHIKVKYEIQFKIQPPHSTAPTYNLFE